MLVGGRTRVSDVDAVSFSLYLSVGSQSICVKYLKFILSVLIRCVLPVDLRTEFELAGSQSQPSSGKSMVSGPGGGDQIVRLFAACDPLEGTSRTDNTLKSQGTFRDNDGRFRGDILIGRRR
jgi:hypothetical protein